MSHRTDRESSRRTFLQASLGAGAGLIAGAGAIPGLTSRAFAQEKPAGGGLKILVLGGTRFLGPAVVDAAVARGHTVTLFNRGKSNPGMYPDLEQLIGDRDPAKGEGLKALEGRSWDAVIDNSGYYPRMVKASADLLAPKSGFYLFVSSVSALASHDEPNSDETAPTGVLTDPTVETMGTQGEHYGPLKAACERTVVESFGEARACNVRPGYIVGPFDGTDRFTYWPLRVRKGGEIPVPGAPTDPVQIIDVRDLGEWMVRLAESKTAGLYNAVGPKDKLEVGAMLKACKDVTGSDASFVHIDGDFCQEHGFGTPIVIPMIEKHRGFHTVRNDRAVKAGLAFRPLAATVKDTLAWFDGLPAERRERLRADVAPAKEAEILEAWKARKS